MTDREELEIAVKALDSRKAKNITALKVEDLTILANYFIIASATSTTQVKALADEVEYQLGEKAQEHRGLPEPDLDRSGLLRHHRACVPGGNPGFLSAGASLGGRHTGGYFRTRQGLSVS